MVADMDSFTLMIVALSLTVLALSVAVVWFAIKSGKGEESYHDQFSKLGVQLDEQSKRIGRLEDRLQNIIIVQAEAASKLREELGVTLANHNSDFEKRQRLATKETLEALQTGMTNTQQQIGQVLTRHSDDLGKRMQGLTDKTDRSLKDISREVEKRLAEGFEKTTATFSDVLKRLALIDEAQKEITKLSSNVVSLQEILSDKKARGAFGEVQLNDLIKGVLPEQHFKLQHTLSNGKIVDCVLFLPDPTGMLTIDSKFPMESYQTMMDESLANSDRLSAKRQFKQDIKKHIRDIATKYIIPGETSDGAIMFIPAEVIFAEIQAHHPDLVQESHQAHVWIVSPTTLWAVVNTARAVLKDAATREQVHIIRDHLGYLAIDFNRFQKRMDNLARHIGQANKDVEEVHTSARKINSRFQQIERVELEHDDAPTALKMDD